MRSARLLAAGLTEIRSALRAAGPQVSTNNGEPRRRLIAAYLDRRQSLARLLLVLTILTLTLAAVGLYGLLGYEVSNRRRELAVRMSLGAQPLSIWRLVGLRGSLASGSSQAWWGVGLLGKRSDMSSTAWACSTP